MREVSMVAAVIAATLTKSRKDILRAACDVSQEEGGFDWSTATNEDLVWMVGHSLIDGQSVMIATRLGRKVHAEVLRTERSYPFRWWYASSEDAETWSPAASREDAIALANDDFCDPVVVMRARHIPFDLDVANVDDIIEAFEHRNEDLWGEDGPTKNFTPEHLQVLDLWLRSVIIGWFAFAKPYTPFMLDEHYDVEVLAPEKDDG